MSLIRKIRNGSLYPLYIKLIDGSSLSDTEKLALLSVAIECHRSEDEISRSLGYRIAVAYSIRFSDYEPLLNLAASEGFAPLVSALLKKIPDLSRKRMGQFSVELLEATVELFQRDGATLTNAQWALEDFFKSNVDRNLAISAPTSFGKSELIVDYCKMHFGSKICIIVPTKALIAQTRQRLLNVNKTDINASTWNSRPC